MRFVVDDETDELYFRTVWHLADALLVLGARDRVVPALVRLVDEAVAGQSPDHRERTG